MCTNFVVCFKKKNVLVYDITGTQKLENGKNVVCLYRIPEIPVDRFEILISRTLETCFLVFEIYAVKSVTIGVDQFIVFYDETGAKMITIDFNIFIRF